MLLPLSVLQLAGEAALVELYRLLKLTSKMY